MNSLDRIKSTLRAILRPFLLPASMADAIQQPPQVMRDHADKTYLRRASSMHQRKLRKALKTLGPNHVGKPNSTFQYKPAATTVPNVAHRPPSALHSH